MTVAIRSASKLRLRQGGSINGLRGPADLVIFYALLCVVLSVILMALNAKIPMVGCDNRYFLTRLLDSYLYYLKNGPAVEWWTPSFAGGLPSYPNPQQVQFTLNALLVFFVNPWVSFVATVAVFVVISYFSVYRLFRGVLSFTHADSVLAAVLFCTSAFYLVHMMVGHMNWETFPLIPLSVLLLADASIPVCVAVIGLTLVAASMVYSGGGQLASVAALSVLMSVNVIYIFSRSVKRDYMRLWRCVAWAATASACLCASKIAAVISFMRFFPRHISDVYNVGLLKGFLGTAAQLFYSPVALFFLEPSKVKSTMSGFLGIIASHWEYDIGLSPVVLVIALLSVKNMGTIGGRIFSRENVPYVILLLFTIWVTLELTLARGYVYTFLKGLPYFRSLHVNTRYAAVFILPVVIGALYAFRISFSGGVLRPVYRRYGALALACLAAALFLRYMAVPGELGCNNLDVETVITGWKNLRAHYKEFKIYAIFNINEEDTFLTGISSGLITEPIFGYGYDGYGYNVTDYVIETDSGFTGTVKRGHFNMINPAGMVFPAENGLSPFNLINESDKENFVNFSNYKPTTWKLSTTQRVCNYVSLLSLVVIAAMAAMCIQRRLKRGSDYFNARTTVDRRKAALLIKE
ncbi:MAG: hypothetical protein HQK89_03710 [Nitrospirae bacterium]|nr:hypothetical protein [Nitrospirota bacterium]